jgi:hypothetical protein
MVLVFPELALAVCGCRILRARKQALMRKASETPVGEIGREKIWGNLDFDAASRAERLPGYAELTFRIGES